MRSEALENIVALLHNDDAPGPSTVDEWHAVTNCDRMRQFQPRAAAGVAERLVGFLQRRALAVERVSRDVVIKGIKAALLRQRSYAAAAGISQPPPSALNNPTAAANLSSRACAS